MSAIPQQALCIPPRIVTFSCSLSTTSSGWNGFTLRQLVSASLLRVSGSLIQLALQAPSSAGFIIDSLYVGHAAAVGDAYDFDGTQVRLTQRGSNTISANATETVLTDSIAYALDEAKALIVAAHFSAASSVSGTFTSLPGAVVYQKSGVSEAGTTNVSGYTAIVAAGVVLLKSVEVLA